MNIHIRGIFCALTCAAITIWLASGAYSLGSYADGCGAAVDPFYSFSEHKPAEPRDNNENLVIPPPIFLDTGKPSGHSLCTGANPLDKHFILPSVRAPPPVFFCIKFIASDID
jgi:hypothetical protein